MTARCVLLFARSPELEGKAKGLYAERGVFELGRRRVARAAAELGAVLVVSGGAPAPEGALRLPQRGRSFGERLLDALAGARTLGFLHVVVVPSDVPALSTAPLGEAFAALDAGEVPLGPSPDGGAWLIGVDTRAAGSLAGVRWLTPFVLEDLVAVAERQGRGIRLLDPLRDVDAHEDLVALAGEPHDAELERLARALLASASERPSQRRAARFDPSPRDRASRAPPLLAAA
jgi:2-phospho-L-lactate guanylyltransferase (CobY/MobA/RfbA family)